MISRAAPSPALKPLGYEIINLGGHETITINDLMERFEEIIGKKANLQYSPANKADMSASWADVSKARQLLEWEPRSAWMRASDAVVDWYRQEHAWASQVDTE